MKIVLIAIFLSSIISISCTSVASQEPTETDQVVKATQTPEPEPTPFVLTDEYRTASVKSLCSRLHEIKKLPNKDPNETDPIYEALILKGSEAVPCLIDKIYDATLMKDPRCPVWEHYAVGDTAVFVLLRILSKDDTEWQKLFLDSLPLKYREQWAMHGVYAYFNYVADPQNRKELQKWWFEWAKDNLK